MTRSLARVTALAALALGIGLGLVPSHTVSAQPRPDDLKYCEAMIGLYRTYVSDPDNGHNMHTPNAQDEVAISRCRKGDSSGIPTLEKALRDQKINLPPRG